VKSGQIAHLDHDRSNSAEDNMVFLCLRYHDKHEKAYAKAIRQGLSDIQRKRTVSLKSFAKKNLSPILGK